jgi:hypothetical protein
MKLADGAWTARPRIDPENRHVRAGKEARGRDTRDKLNRRALRYKTRSRPHEFGNDVICGKVPAAAGIRAE